MKTERSYNFSTSKSNEKSVQSCRGGSPCPPEQSTRIKQLASVMKAVILIFYVTDYKIQLPYGRAQRPAPTTTDFIFSAQPRLCEKLPRPTSNI